VLPKSRIAVRGLSPRLPEEIDKRAETAVLICNRSSRSISSWLSHRFVAVRILERLIGASLDRGMLRSLMNWSKSLCLTRIRFPIRRAGSSPSFIQPVTATPMGEPELPAYLINGDEFSCVGLRSIRVAVVGSVVGRSWGFYCAYHSPAMTHGYISVPSRLHARITARQ